MLIVDAPSQVFSPPEEWKAFLDEMIALKLSGENVDNWIVVANNVLKRGRDEKSWDESEHPRDEHGRWTDAGDGDSGDGETPPVPKPPFGADVPEHPGRREGDRFEGKAIYDERAAVSYLQKSKNLKGVSTLTTVLDKHLGKKETYYVRLWAVPNAKGEPQHAIYVDRVGRVHLFKDISVGDYEAATWRTDPYQETIKLDESLPPSSPLPPLVAAGSANEKDDFPPVMAELQKLPPGILSAMAARGLKVTVCRGSVTEVQTNLKGKIPRGWKGSGYTWDNVPGLSSKTGILIATRGNPPGSLAGPRHVPRQGEDHGSANLVLHEALHAYDEARLKGSSGRFSHSDDFIRAREADIAELSSYQKQKNGAGLQETFAETGAMFFSDQWPAGKMPHLREWWENFAKGLRT